MLKTVLLLHIFVETVILFLNRKFKRTVFFEIECFCKIINVFIDTFDPFNASLLNKV